LSYSRHVERAHYIITARIFVGNLTLAMFPTKIVKTRFPEENGFLMSNHV